MKNTLLAIGITILVVAGYALYLSARLGSGMRLTLPRPDELAAPSDFTAVKPLSVLPEQKKSPPQRTVLPAVSVPAEAGAAPVATTTETAAPNGIPQ